ncbi:MAG: hypothetical protein Ct9H300mP1_02240 [Planctomycetaceae bacterium]|nr:MAG: hypothetical protein Ct9H300mP1_02240 [Planctomycetaceae bacterium]
MIATPGIAPPTSRFGVPGLVEVVESVRGEDVVGNGVFADAELQRDPAGEVRDARVQLATGGDTPRPT